MNNLIVVTDFDGTLMKEDVGDTLMEALGVNEKPEPQELIRKFLNKEVGSLKWIEAAYAYFDGRKAEVDAVIEHVTPRQGAMRFLEFCRSKDVPVIILSDGMQYYIEQLTQKFGIVVQEVISNPIMYKPDGEFTLGYQNPNENCRWCGCCKADAVRKLKESGASIVYIGDGTSDLYGSSYADWVFARSTLARYLTERGEQYYPFETFDDIMDVFQKDFNNFSNGMAGSKRMLENTFCKF